MVERLRATGLRTRLAATVAAILVIAAGATYVAVYRGTGARIREQISAAVATQGSALAARIAAAPTGARPGVVLRRARRTIAAQPTFTASSSLLVVRVAGAGVATNDPELLGLLAPNGEPESPVDRNSESGEAAAILSASPGLSTISLGDAGEVQLDARRIQVGGTTAEVIVGQPLEPVESAQRVVSRTFLIAGSITLAAALLAALFAAAKTAAPLRRMAQTASAVDSGDLTHRMPDAGPREIRQLAESFNRMLDRLEDAFARQRAFVSDASHELRTPLTAIRGQIEVLARTSDPSAEEVAATEARIVRDVGRMDRLVDDLLLLAQSDEGLVSRTEAVDPAELIPETVLGIARGSRREVALGPIPVGRLRCDPDRLAQVLGNLVRNAIEHTDASSSVEVGARAAGGSLCVFVDDDGPGIPPDQRAAVFDRFHRSDASRARRSGGSGLGLAIAGAIVDAHGGRIWVETSRTGGARVAFELPGFRPG